MTLNGCSSGPGECGQPVYEKGYIWYLVAKPPNSAAMLNTEGTCITQFTPDLPGEYEVALIVYDAGQTHYQSNFASVKIQVAE